MLFFSIFLLVVLFEDFYIRKDFTSPTFLMLASYVLASWLIYLNTENWHVHINTNFYIFVILFICSWIFASFLVRLNLRRCRRQSKIIVVQRLRNNLSREKIVFIMSLILLVGYIYILIKRFAGTNILFLLRMIYDYDESTDSSHFLQHQIEIVSVSLIYISFFCILKKKFIENDKRKSFYLVFSMFILLFIVLMTTDRNKFIRLFIFCFCIWIFFMHNYSTLSKKAANRIIFKYTLLLGTIVMLLFYGLGKAKQYTSNFERMIGIYGGSGLYNFNLFLDSFTGNFSFGNETFGTFFKTLSSFIPISEDFFSSKQKFGFIIFNTGHYVYASNVYAAIALYYADFGVAGIIFFSLFLGAFFEVFYQLAKKDKGGFIWVLYATFVYPTFYIAIVEQFFHRFHLGIIYEFFWITVLYFFFFKFSTRYFRFHNTKRL